MPHRSRTNRLVLILILITATLLTLVSGVIAVAEPPVVKMYLFHSSECPNCKGIVNEYLPTLETKYGEQLEVHLLDIADPDANELLLALEETYGVDPDRATVPEAFLGNLVLVGAGEIRQQLDRTIEELIAAGGAALPQPNPTPPPIAPTNTPPPQGSIEGAVHAMLFFSPSCPHCEYVRQEVLPPLYEKYGEKLVVREFDVSEPYNFSLEIAIEQAAGMPAEQQGYIPFMVVGHYLLTNSRSIEEGLDQIIQEGLEEGGFDWPVDPKYFVPPEETPSPAATQAGPAATPAAEVTGEAGGPTPAGQSPSVHMAYFTKTGCQECDRAQYEINYLKDKYPFLDVTVFDVQEDAALNEWLSDKHEVPDKYRLTAPAIFVGQDYLVGPDVSTQKIEQLIQKYAQEGVGPTWENWEAEASQASSRIIERFKSFGMLTVLAAGLVDGLNPCAFATIVFFVSYLAFTGRKGKEILLVGSAFALGVFVTYLTVGLGLYHVLQRLPFLASLGKWVYGITAALCFVLAGLSLVDYFTARKGRPEEMRLRLPMRLRRRINALIRDSANTKAFAGVAFVTGLAISVIELACTGQVYLPTILFVLGVPELRTSATLYLVLYNLLFVSPLLVVFALAYLGTSSDRMAQFVNQNTARIKLATACLFVVLGGWLITLLL